MHLVRGDARMHSVRKGAWTRRGVKHVPIKCMGIKEIDITINTPSPPTRKQQLPHNKRMGLPDFQLNTPGHHHHLQGQNLIVHSSDWNGPGPER